MSKTMKPFRIGLPKGRYQEISEKVLLSFDLKVIEGVLNYQVPNCEIEFFLAKAPDIPKLVYIGVFDIGLSADEWLYEFELGQDLDNSENKILFRRHHLANLGIRISVLVEKYEKMIIGNCTSLATCYPNISRKFLDNNNSSAKVLHISGSTEAYVPQISDIAIDCVETGKTAFANNLKEENVIYDNLGVSFVTLTTNELLLTRMWKTIISKMEGVRL